MNSPLQIQHPKDEQDDLVKMLQMYMLKHLWPHVKFIKPYTKSINNWQENLSFNYKGSLKIHTWKSAVMIRFSILLQQQGQHKWNNI